MEKKVVCNISEEDRDNIEENLSMLNAIDKLVMIIANNNSILKEESILSAINTAGLEKLKAIKELLPDDISYEDIKLVIEKNGLN